MREGFTSGLKPGHEHWGTHVWQEGWAGWQRKHSEIGHTGRWGGLTQWDWAHRQVRGPGTVRAAHRQVTESGHTGEGAMEQKGWDEGESLQGELENHWVHSTWRPCTVIVTQWLDPSKGSREHSAPHAATLGAWEPPLCVGLWVPLHTIQVQALLPPSSSTHVQPSTSRAQHQAASGFPGVLPRTQYLLY